MLAPINTNKHFIARTNSTITGGTVVALVIADAVVAPAAANTFDVVEGAVIKAFRSEMWISSDEATGNLTQCVIIIEKVPSNQVPATFVNMQNLQAYDNKKNILFTFQGNIGSTNDGAQPMSPIRDWLLIPKGKQRFGRGDRLIMSIAAITQNIQTCGMFIYKEYR